MKNTDIKNQIQNEVAGMAIRQGVRRAAPAVGNLAKNIGSNVMNRAAPAIQNATRAARTNMANSARNLGNQAVQRGQQFGQQAKSNVIPFAQNVAARGQQFGRDAITRGTPVVQNMATQGQQLGRNAITKATPVIQNTWNQGLNTGSNIARNTPQYATSAWNTVSSVPRWARRTAYGATGIGAWNEVLTNPTGATADFAQQVVIPTRQAIGSVTGPGVEKVFSAMGYGGENSTGNIYFNTVDNIMARMSEADLQKLSASVKEELQKYQQSGGAAALSQPAINELQQLDNQQPPQQNVNYNQQVSRGQAPQTQTPRQQPIANNPQNAAYQNMRPGLSVNQESASCSAGMAVFESPPKYKKHEAVLKKFIDKKRFELDEDETKKLKKD